MNKETISKINYLIGYYHGRIMFEIFLMWAYIQSFWAKYNSESALDIIYNLSSLSVDDREYLSPDVCGILCAIQRNTLRNEYMERVLFNRVLRLREMPPEIYEIQQQILTMYYG